MDTLTLARFIGLGVLFVVFVITVALMPRILGVNPPSEAADTPDAAAPPAPAAVIPAPASEPAAAPPPVGEPVKT